jgi:hypothetical protein
MQGKPRTCQSCGHPCHCYSPDCETCSCDVCGCGTVKNYDAKEDIPDSFIKPNT